MESDKLLDVEQAAEILNTSPDWLYHRWKELPFAVKLSERQLRFSLQGIQEYIKNKRFSGTLLIVCEEEKQDGDVSSKHHI